jgi:hypothetical protein
MAAATITARVPTYSTNEEHVVLTITDGETFVSEKFTTVLAVDFSFNEDMATLAVVPGFAISGNTLTFHCTGVTDKLVSVRLRGN